MVKWLSDEGARKRRRARSQIEPDAGEAPRPRGRANPKGWLTKRGFYVLQPWRGGARKGGAQDAKSNRQARRRAQEASEAEKTG